ncbi:nuclear transport factor 2 family protein [Aestuariivivens sediminis]|uniref:nuclear transport factor 2 family protein n=1 Tax=Aestuariivivens sediminis TaxID=2913557 RepID=UPI001F580C81|nr:nuclear transport factor 2 family protein [Aestuariivivens sediminis]
MKSNIEIIEELYRDFSNGNIESIKEKFAPEIEWIQMKGFPNGGCHIGFDDIQKNVFKKFNENWTNWTANVDEFLDAGESIFAIGHYEGKYNKTGKSFKADFIHRYGLKEGQITKFTQYTDTNLVVKAMA